MRSTILGHDVIKTITGVSTIKCSLFHGGEGEEQTKKLDHFFEENYKILVRSIRTNEYVENIQIMR